MSPEATQGEAKLVPVGFSDLASFDGEGCAAAFAGFRQCALAWSSGQPSLRPARAVEAGLEAAFAAALSVEDPASAETAEHFLRKRFAPFRIDAEAFFTGYYEPVVDGSLDRRPGFTAPLLARPHDLRTFAADEPRPAWASDLSAARVGPDGSLTPYPDRATIEAAIGTGPFTPVVWLRDWVEVFFIHVQGSARVRLPDGRELQLTYAGRNGRPYTSIGRVLADSGAMTPDAMSLEALKGWIRERGQAPGEAGRTLMQRNASYIFFDASEGTAGTGPTGGAGVPLTALRSIAIDRTRWCYGLVFHVDAVLPWSGDPPSPFRRMLVAQDTGSAIAGPARVDIFFGTGDAAGRLAGSIRHRGTLSVLLPRHEVA